MQYRATTIEKKWEEEGEEGITEKRGGIERSRSYTGKTWVEVVGQPRCSRPFNINRITATGAKDRILAGNLVKPRNE